MEPRLYLSICSTRIMSSVATLQSQMQCLDATSAQCVTHDQSNRWQAASVWSRRCKEEVRARPFRGFSPMTRPKNSNAATRASVRHVQQRAQVTTSSGQFCIVTGHCRQACTWGLRVWTGNRWRWRRWWQRQWQLPHGTDSKFWRQVSEWAVS